MSAKALLAALGFVLLIGTFAFSLWAEWGPYAWVAAAQVAIMNSYSEKLAFVLTFVLFLLPIMILLFVWVLRARAAMVLALGVPGLLVLGHLVATTYFVSTGGPQADTATFESAIRSASFVPQNITLKKSMLPALDLEHASGISSSGSSDELYVPFAAASWPSSETMVVLKSTSENLKKLAGGENLTGVLHKSPLPYLVRSTWPKNPSIFAVIIEDGSTVRGSWMGAAAVYVVLLIWGAVNRFKSWRASKAQPAAQI